MVNNVRKSYRGFYEDDFYNPQHRCSSFCFHKYYFKYIIVDCHSQCSRSL